MRSPSERPKGFATGYLDVMLESAGLSPAEVEVFLSLLQGPALPGSLYANGLYQDKAQLKSGVRGLMEKRLLERFNRNKLTLAPERELKRFFLKTEKGVEILSKIRSLRPKCFEIYGMAPNPGIMEGHKPEAGQEAFCRSFALFQTMFPKIEIRAMSRCNINCLYCYYSEGFDQPPDEDVEGEIRKAKQLGVQNVSLNGGEFTIREGNLDIVEAISKAGFKDIELFTNGLRFYQRHLLKAFVDRGLSSIFLHVSAVDRKTYEALTRTPGSFQALLLALENLASFPDLNLTVVTVINKMNLGQLKEIADFFQEYRSRGRFKRFLHYFTNYCLYSSTSNAWKNRGKAMVRMVEAAERVKEVLKTYGGSKRGIYYGRIPLCLMKGWEAESFDLYTSMARFFLDRGKRVTDSKITELAFTKKPSCRECVHNAYCPGVMRGYAKTYGLEEMQPVKKPMAEACSENS